MLSFRFPTHQQGAHRPVGEGGTPIMYLIDNVVAMGALIQEYLRNRVRQLEVSPRHPQVILVLQ